MVDEVTGQNIWVNGISDSGEVVGAVGRTGEARGFVWSEAGGLRHPASIVRKSEICDIDSSGNVLGMYFELEEGVFVWNERGGMRMLSISDCDAVCRMNDRGDILGEVAKKEIKLFG